MKSLGETETLYIDDVTKNLPCSPFIFGHLIHTTINTPNSPETAAALQVSAFLLITNTTCVLRHRCLALC